ncbi:MAG: SBBP repeat-containing protein [Promethearchaeota archaeon]
MESNQKMKNIKIYLLVFILILYFSYILHGTNITINNQDDKDGMNVVLPIAIDSVVYEWQYLWSGDDGDFGRGTVVDSSDNVYLAGYTWSFGAGAVDMVLIKCDGNGVQQWNRTWGGTDSDYGYGVAVDSLGNINIVGYTQSYGAGMSDLLWVKYDGNGVQKWNRTWGGTGTEAAYGVAVDSSDNIYLTGETRTFGAGMSDLVLVKYDSSGVQQWNHTWGGTESEFCYGVAVDSLDNVYVSGVTGSFGGGGNDMVLVKYDGNGVQQWNRTWGGTDLDWGYGVAVDSSDNIYHTGRTRNFGMGNSDLALVKYDSSGVQQWNRTWGGPDNDVGVDVAMDSSDNIYVSGVTRSFGAGNSDLVLVKFDGNGVLQWNHTWGGTMNDEGYDVAVDSSDNIYLAGYTYSFGAGDADMFLVKYGQDIYKPVISINSPSQNEFFGSIAPDFDISIIEPNLNTTWYTLDGGTTNITFSGLTGTIDQTEWGKKGNGMVSIRFYADDTACNIGFIEVSIFKDIDNPEVILSSPFQYEKFREDAPAYNISIIEPNLESMWYTINGGLTNYTITQLSGTINQGAWDAAPYSNIAIRFYAEDLAGNIGYNEVIVQKVREEAIPGYSLFIFISIIGLITATSIKKKNI